MATRELPELSLLNHLFRYEPETGHLIRRISVRGKGSRAGTIVGTPDSDGHLIFRVHYQIVYAHRVIWKMVYGEDPPSIIDHKNGDPSDNRLTNLRLATFSQNSSNCKMHIDNKSGHRGVSFSKAEKKWKAGLKFHGRHVNFGYFIEKEDAIDAYKENAPKYFGEYIRI